jgi:hypothetical protein
LTDHPAGAFASRWHAFSVNHCFTNSAAGEKVEDSVEEIKDKASQVNANGQMSCAAAVADQMLADFGQNDGTSLVPFL